MNAHATWHWKAARTIGYLMLAAAGLAVLIHPPVSYSSATTWLTVAWGLLLVLPGIIAAAGVAFGRYAWEWIATWFLAAGLAIYALLSWGTVASAPGNAPRALILTGYVGMLVARAFQMGVEDRRARLAVVTRQEVRGE